MKKRVFLMEVDYESIGLRIKIARIKARMSQQVLAERTDFSVAHISNIETGNTKLSLPAIINIANTLSVSVDQLLCDNMVCSDHVLYREAQEFFAGCASTEERRFLLDVLKSTKEAMEKNQRLFQRLYAKES